MGRLYKNKFYSYIPRYLTVLLAFITIVSCSVTKHVQEQDYLLNKTKIIIDNNEIDVKDMKGYYKQRPNKRIFGILRFHLGLYNLSKQGSTTGLNEWLRKIGEEPVVYDDFTTQKTSQQFELFLNKKGYWNARVKDSVFLHNKKAEVYYIIEADKPHIISNISYQVEENDYNKELWNLVLNDTANSLLSPGIYFEEDILQREMERITRLAKDNGYFNFSQKFLHYYADTVSIRNYADLTLDIVDNIQKDSISGQRHYKYEIDKVTINTIDNSIIDLSIIDDTLNYNGISFIYNINVDVKPEVIIQRNYIQHGDAYSMLNSELTFKSLSSLGIFKNINIIYVEKENKTKNNSSTKLLDCIIQLIPYKPQLYDVALEGTHSNGNLGVAGNLLYRHKNLFNGAEDFNLKFNGSLEMINDNAKNLDKIIAYGFEARLSSPKFFLPIRTDDFYKRYNPKTSFSFVYNYQDRPDYTRQITKLNFGYFWNGSPYLKHIINPIEFNSVNVSNISDNFSDIIRGTYIENSYQTHMVTSTRYSMIFNNQSRTKNSDVVFLRFNLESGGNLLTGVNNIFSNDLSAESYNLFGTRYAQFVRADVELKRLNFLNGSNSVAYRAFLGAGLPYGNMDVLPFEKQFYSGGANGIRAWQVRSLGPGSYKIDDSGGKVFYPNQLGDIKIELNLEYRFDLFWVLEGAVFLDAGNIWAINNSDDREGAVFKLNNFYNQIAVGSGIGARLDFNFFLLRLDLGVKIRDPGMAANSRWIPGNTKYSWDHLTFNLGIGYPF